jgi:hypothetical protein
MVTAVTVSMVTVVVAYVGMVGTPRVRMVGTWKSVGAAHIITAVVAYVGMVVTTYMSVLLTAYVSSPL